MPDAAATDTKGASEGEDKNPPDLVGEELADSAKIWRVYERVAKEDDERRTKEWDNGLNNLALFAGLFSAVTTAFIIEARQDMEPDYAQLTFLVLNATAFGEKAIHQPFVITSSARTVNCLWVASLILSLSAALIAIMGKDWIGMYTARPVCNLRQWAEMRTYRILCVERWYMSSVIAAAPVLLHVSLVLFGAGLVLFISSDPFTHHLTLGLSLAAGALYLVTTLSAIAFSASPFKSPATQMIRAAFSAFSSYVHNATIRPKRDLVGTILRDVNVMVVGRADESDFIQASVGDAHPQPGLTGHAALLSRLHHYIYPSEHNAIPSLLRDVNTLVVGRGDDFGLLPSSSPIRQRHNLQSATVVNAAGKTLVTLLQSLPSSLRAAYQSLQWSRAQSWLRSMASLALRLSFDWFLSSTWTDLPADRRPELLAAALSWLSGASQAPEVFRAIVFALGDLDVGPQVGKHTPPALRTRLRAEIRRTWKRVDFLTLARYVLADQNTPGNPALDYGQFEGRFDMSKESAMRCEDGLAAVIRADPDDIYYRDLAQYSPDHVAQPRMLELLLSYGEKTHRFRTDDLILLSNRYRKHLWTTDSFNLRNLEAHLDKTLGTYICDAYATEVTVEYGGTAGAIELLTFLCCNGIIEDATKRAAVELAMELLGRQYLVREHRCLAYLFGNRELWDAVWKDKRWSPWYLYWLSESLEVSLLHPFKPTSVRTLADDRQFDLALARTAVMILSPQYRATLSAQQLYPLGLIEREERWIEFLHGYLCQSPSPSVPDKDEQPDVIRLILDSAALHTIVRMSDDYGYRGVVNSGSAILAVIISHVGHRLCNAATIHNGEQLFAALARAEVEGPEGETCIWDLGKWLRTRAPEFAGRHPSAAIKLQDVYDALGALYPMCEHNPKLRAIWDRLGYSGPPEDIVYFCDPYLDLGDFFARAEDPLS